MNGDLSQLCKIILISRWIVFCCYQEGLYFPGGEDDKLFFYPDTQITTNIIEELRIPLDIIYQSKYSYCLSLSSLSSRRVVVGVCRIAFSSALFTYPSLQGCRASIRWWTWTKQSVRMAIGTCTRLYSIRRRIQVSNTRSGIEMQPIWRRTRSGGTTTMS